MSDYSIVPNAALTATADAIRTKSGSQATIEFDHNTGFKDAVDAIPGGGGTHSASGSITVVSDISITAEDPQSVNFPGLQLPFQPDYLCVWYDLDEYKTAGSNAPNYNFILVIRNLTTFPPIRLSTTVSTVSACANSDYIFFTTHSKSSCSDSLLNGYAATIAASCFVNLSLSSGWSVNSNGTLTVSNGTTGAVLGNFKITAGTWHYYALKG